MLLRICTRIRVYERDGIMHMYIVNFYIYSAFETFQSILSNIVKFIRRVRACVSVCMYVLMYVCMYVCV